MGSLSVGTVSWIFGMIPYLEQWRDLMPMPASKCGLAVFLNVLVFNSQYWPYAARLQDCILHSFLLGNKNDAVISSFSQVERPECQHLLSKEVIIVVQAVRFQVEYFIMPFLLIGRVT